MIVLYGLLNIIFCIRAAYLFCAVVTIRLEHEGFSFLVLAAIAYSLDVIGPFNLLDKGEKIVFR